MRVLVTGGRAPSALEICRLLKGAGHHVVIAESLTFPISRFSNSVEKYYSVPSARFHTLEYGVALRKIIEHERIDIVIPTCEEIFYIAQVKSDFPESCFVWCDEFSKLDLLHNKYRFIEYAKEKGFAVPHTRLLSERNQADKEAKRGNVATVFKPVYSRFASHTKIVHKDDSLPRDINPTHERPWVAQEYIEGAHLCTYSLCLNGKVLAHTTYPPQERWGIGSSIVFQHVPHPVAETWVREFASTIHFTGQISFDFIQALDGVLYPIECNPRTTSGVHLFTPKDTLIASFAQNPATETGLPRSTTVRSIKLALVVRFVRLLISGKPRADLKKTWEFIRISDDILSDSNDPLPGLGQFISLGEFVLRGLLVGLSPTETATYDSGYDGNQENP